MEKLVEEITREIRSVMIRYAKWSSQGLLRATHEEMAQGVAQKVIIRIGKAYADGELILTKVPPKLPGEVGRQIPDYDGQRIAGRKGHTYICLRKEEQQSNMPRYCEHCGSEEHHTSEH